MASCCIKAKSGRGVRVVLRALAKTCVFYDELHVIIKILVTEERINGVWGELNSETRLVATLDVAGVPQN